MLLSQRASLRTVCVRRNIILKIIKMPSNYRWHTNARIIVITHVCIARVQRKIWRNKREKEEEKKQEKPKLKVKIGVLLDSHTHRLRTAIWSCRDNFFR